MSRLYRAVGSGFLGFKVCSQRNQSDQLLVNAQALNMSYTLSFKGAKVMEDVKRGPDQM